MSHHSIINNLVAADAFMALEFYVTKPDNRGPELHCRIRGGFENLPLSKVQQVAEDLNSITKEYREAEAKKLRTIAASELQP